MTRRRQAAFSSVREQQEHKESSGITLDGRERVTPREHDEAGEGGRGPSTQDTVGQEVTAMGS